MTIWEAVDRVVDAATDHDAMRAHGLGLWAAQRWPESGRSVPEDFREHERAAMMAVLSVPMLLQWVRDALDGPVLLLKGPEVAARYPDPARRPFGDLDLLVLDADDAQRRLIAAGCVEVSPTSAHHRPALQPPGSLLMIEVHERPKWPHWTDVDPAELFASAQPSVLGIDGIQTVHPAHHAVLLAAHSWKHEPFRRVIDLVDIAAMMQEADADEVQRVAERWGLGRVWDATVRAIDAFERGTRPRRFSERLVGRHLWTVTERTPFGQHVARWAHGYWAPTPSPVVRTMIVTLARDTRPLYGESLASKARHSLGILADSSRSILGRRLA